MRNFRRALAIAVSAMAGAWINALVFLVAVSRKEYMPAPGILEVLSAPVLVGFALIFGTLAGLFISPVACAMLWRRSLRTAVPIVYGTSLVCSAIAGRVFGPAGRPLALLATIAALILAGTSVAFPQTFELRCGLPTKESDQPH